MNEELRKKLDDAIRYLSDNGSIKQTDLDNLLTKRFPGLKVEDVKKNYPDLQIVSNINSADENIITEPFGQNTSNEEPLVISKVEEISGRLRQQLLLKNVVQARHFLAELEPLAAQVVEMDAFRLKVAHLESELEHVYEDITKLESAGKYYALRDKISGLEVTFNGFPGLEDLRSRVYAKIHSAEAHLSVARTKKAGQERIEYYLLALEECKDCIEAIEALSLLPPEPPGNLDVLELPKSILLKWVPSSSSMGVTYRLLRKFNGTPISPNDGEILVETTQYSFEDHEIVPGGIYYYAVYSIRGEVVSKSAIIKGPVLYTAEVSDITITAGNRKIQIQWHLPPNAKGIAVYRSLNHAPSPRQKGQPLVRLGAVQEFIDYNVHNELTYGYLISVVFKDISGTDFYTNGVEISGTPVSPPIPIRSLVAHIEGELIKLEWESSSNGKIVIIRSSVPVTSEIGELFEAHEIEKFGEQIDIFSGTNQTTYLPCNIGTHFFTAFSLAHNMAVMGVCASLNYTPGISDLQKIVNGHELFLEWKWPDYCEWVRIEYSNDAYAFEHVGSQEMIVKIVSRKDYNFRHGFLLRNIEQKVYYFRLFVIPYPDAYQATWSVPVTILVDNARLVDVKYHISISRNIFGKPRNAFLHIFCDEYEQLPVLELYYALGSIPRKKEDGKFIMRIGRYEFSSTQIKVEIPIECIGSNHYGKLFFEGNEIAHFRLRPPKLENLQLF